MKENSKSDLLYGIFFIIGIITLFFITSFFQNDSIKLIYGGLFLIIVAIIEGLRSQDKYLIIFLLSCGALSLIVGFSLPSYVNLFLIILYLIFLTFIILLFGGYITRGDKFTKKKKMQELIFRTFYFFLSIILTYSVYITIKAVMVSFLSLEAIPFIDYLLFIIYTLISLFSVFLFVDNLFRIKIAISQSDIIFPKVKYRAYYSFLISLSLIILTAGYYYINHPTNEFFQRLMIVIGLAFISSLYISNSLKELLSNKR